MAAEGLVVTRGPRDSKARQGREGAAMPPEIHLPNELHETSTAPWAPPFPTTGCDAAGMFASQSHPANDASIVHVVDVNGVHLISQLEAKQPALQADGMSQEREGWGMHRKETSNEGRGEVEGMNRRRMDSGSAPDHLAKKSISPVSVRMMFSFLRNPCCSPS